MIKKKFLVDSYYKRNRDNILRKLKERYDSDAEYREKIQKTYREKYRNNIEYQKNTLLSSQQRYHEDEFYREAVKNRSRRNWDRSKVSKKHFYHTIYNEFISNDKVMGI